MFRKTARRLKVLFDLIAISVMFHFQNFQKITKLREESSLEFHSNFHVTEEQFPGFRLFARTKLFFIQNIHVIVHVNYAVTIDNVFCVVIHIRLKLTSIKFRG